MSGLSCKNNSLGNYNFVLMSKNLLLCSMIQEELDYMKNHYS